MTVTAAQIVGEVIIDHVREARQDLYAVADAADHLIDKFNQLRPRSELVAQHLNKTGDEAKSTGNALENMGSRGQSALSKLASAGSASLHGLSAGFAGVKNGITGMLANLGLAAQGIGTIATVAMSLGNALTKPHAELQSLTASFKTFLKTDEAAQKMMADVKELADKIAPFETAALAEGAANLLSMEVAAKDTIPYMTAIGNAVAGLNLETNELSSIARIFGEINTTGKLTGETMTQLRDKGINVMGILEKQTGKSRAELEALMSSGQLLAADVLPALRDGFNAAFPDAMLNKASTFSGRLSTLSDGLKNLWILATKPIFNVLNEGLAKIVALVQNDALINFATGIGEEIGTAFQKIGDFATGAVKGVQDFIGQLDKPSVANFFRGLENIRRELGFVLDIIGGTAKNIFGQFTENLGQSGLTAENVSGILGRLGNIFTDISKYVHEFGTFLSGINWAPFVDGAQKIVGLLSDQFSKTLETVGKDLQALGTWIEQKVVPAVEKAMPGFQSLGETLMTDVIPAVIEIRGVVMDLVQHALEKLAPVIGKIVPPMIEFGGLLAGKISDAVKFLTPIIVDITKEVGKFASELIDRVAPIAENTFNNIKKNIDDFSKFWNSIWPTVREVLKGVWEQIEGVVKIAWSFISGYIKIALDIFNGDWAKAWEDAKVMLSGVWEGMKKVIQGWLDIIKALVAPLAQWFTDRWNDIKNGIAAKWGEITKGVSDWWAGVNKTLSDRVADIKNNILKPFSDAAGAIGGVIKGFVNNMIDQVNLGIAAVQNFANAVGNGIQDVAKNIGVTIDVKDIYIPRIPHYAKGTGAHPGGMAVVGEEGPELALLPRGTSVIPHDLSKVLMSMMGGKIPGYADGTGDIWSVIGSGASGVLDWMLRAFNIQPPNLGLLTDLASGVFNRVKDAALQWITDHLPKIDFSAGAGGSSFGDFSGALKDWIAQAIAIRHVPGDWAGPLATIAMHESGGNPRAVNNWDINAINGTPSMGLMQTIEPTFRAYMMAGMGDILNPVHNAVAAIGYILSRYGSVFNVPGIMALSRGQAYVGYANGGVIREPIVGRGLRTGTNYSFGERGDEYVVPRGRMLPPGVQVVPATGGGITINVTVQPPDLTIDGYRLTQQQMPHLVQIIREVSGNRY